MFARRLYSNIIWKYFRRILFCGRCSLVLRVKPCRNRRKAAIEFVNVFICRLNLFVHRAFQISGVLTALCWLPLSLAAQQSPGCKGPSDLEQAIAGHPSAAAYDALGAYFAGHHQLSCAIHTFESAIHLAPNSWEGHYDLGIALFTNRDLTRAARELQTASSLHPN